MMAIERPEHGFVAELEWGIGGQMADCQKRVHSTVGIKVRMMMMVR